MSSTTVSARPGGRRRPGRSRARGPRLIQWLFAAAVIGVLAGLAGAWSGASERTALIVALLVVVPIPFWVRGFQRRFDPFEPIQLLALAILVLFVWRPLAELQYDIKSYGSYLTRPGFNGALLIVLVGTSALYLGYFFGPARRVARALPTMPRRWDTDRSVRFAAGLLLVAAGLTVLFAATSGGFGALLQFYSQRTIGSDSATLRNSSFYIYLGPYLTIPAAILLLHAWMRRKTLMTGVLLAASTLAALALTVPRGDRTFILTLVLPLIALPYLRRERRPRLWAIVLTIVVTFMAANVLRSERFAESRQDPLNSAYTALTSPGQQLKDFISGPDPSLFTVLSLEYEAVPRDIGFSPGITPVSILAGPIPGKLWKDKPQPGLVHVTNYLFFQQALVARASFLPSAFGDMYADWGFVTVALYSLIVGVALRAIWDYFRRHQHNAGVQAVFASCLPLVIVFLRNNLGDTLGHSVALVLPIVVCTWVCSRPRGALLPRLRPRRA